MKRFVLFSGVALVVILFPQSVQAGWTRTNGADQDDVGYCVQQTADGGYIIAGRLQGEGGWILKTDEEGDTLWTSSPFGFMGGAAYSVQQTSDGSYILTGYMAATEDGKYHVGLVKIDSLGEEIWWHSDMDWFYDFDSTGGVGLSVDQTVDGGYILTGYRQPLIWEDTAGVWLIKTDPEGELEWSKTYGAEYHACGCCILQTSDGGYIIVGYTEYITPPSPWSLWLLKTDENGDTMWTSGLPDWWSGRGYSVVETPDSGYIVTGYVAPDDDYKYHLIVMRTDSNGNTLWTRMEPGWSPDTLGGVGRCVNETSNGNYILTGYTSEWMDEINDLFLVKMNPDGDTLWTRIYGGEAEDLANCVDQTSDGGYIITGATKSFGAGGYDIWLLKTDANGDTLGIVEEPPVTPVTHPSNWRLRASVGQQIVLQYSDFPHGFHAQVFDATGRKVDEIKSPAQNGVLTWGEKHSPGVYFFKVVEGRKELVQKVVLTN